MKCVIIVHRWEGNPEADWYPWLKKELLGKGFEVLVPELPDPEAPDIETWVSALAEAVGTPDEQTILVGHSLGGQTILRYLAGLNNQKVGGVVLVAPWFKLTPEATPDEEFKAIADPWLNTPLDFEKAKQAAGKIVAIFSDNDPYVPLDQKDFFSQKLGAETLVVPRQGHFTQDDGVTEFKVVLDKILEVSHE